MKMLGRVKNSAEVLMLLFFDILSILVIFQLAVVVRIRILPLIYSGFPPEMPYRHFMNLWWVFVVWAFFFSYEGLYTKRLSFWDEIKTLWKVSFFSTIGIFTIVSIGKLSDEISRTVVILMGFFSLLCLPPVRMFAKTYFRKIGLLKRRVLILGAGKTGRLIAGALRREANYGYEVVGFLDDDPAKFGRRIEGIKVHKGVDRAVTYLKACNIEDVFIAMPGVGKEKLQGLVNNLQHKVERILFVPDMFGIAVLGTGLQHFFHEEALAFEIENNLSNPLNILIKRCFDILLCLLFLPFLAIPAVIIVSLIRLDTRGPAIYSQERLGGKGRTFRCFKFRTMYEDAEERLSDLFQNNHEARSEWERNWKLRDDPRVTRIGRFLRKTSLDELPQIINVLKGEMSLVGPRPVTRDEIDKHYRERAELCFSVLPGITGLWQVSGRSNTSYDYRIALDLWYVRNWNLWLDIVILLKTVRIVLKGEGAY